MRRLNVREAQIDACIRDSMFAIPERPLNPELQPGELLLLQLAKQDATRLKQRHRINFALVFSHLERDYDGSISRRHWPAEGRTWKWIVYASATVPTIPFNLEDLGLSRDYSGQTNPRYIAPADEQRIQPYIQWALAQRPEPELQLIKPLMVAEEFGEYRTLEAIYNHDRVALLEPPTRSTTAEQFIRNPALADTLKSYYDHHCQVCGNDFEPTYGVPFAESHHIHYLRDGGRDVSQNIVVLCPNHHRIVHATNARFDPTSLAYEYPNGLREKLILPNHLAKALSINQHSL
jgi:5-methylcytosine-specific restriction endonuclease McrA